MHPSIPQSPAMPGGSTSVDIPAGSPQAYKQNLSSLIPKSEGTDLMIPYDVNGLTAGNSMTFFCESGVPEVWFIAVRPVANSKVSVFNGPENSGVPIRLGGGGHLKVRAKSEFFTVLAEAGSAAIVGTVFALRGSIAKDFDYDGGAV